jgi:hypothetical protein
MLSNALACGSLTHTRILSRVRKAALVNTFAPRGAVRCLGDAVFRTKAAHDAACLWDLDGSVIGRRCLPEVTVRNKQHHVPDFTIERVSGITFVDVVPIDGPSPPKWAADASEKSGRRYTTFLEASFNEDRRLENARELLRYAAYPVPLRDRARFLAFLDEHGSASLATCISIFRNARDPVGAVASLALQRFVEMDIDEACLGPDTIVCRL